MTGPLVRIVLRYLSGYLIAKGWLAHGTDLAADPDIVLAVGVAIGAVTEVYYMIARKMGWSK
ncbi:MAG: hypothetical protein QM699_07825 [Amaricoccus sp.]|uniref:hypothetical protein n=1 Tax=Amaricoccus sp. TaxID=1872485 RepID=UPI0039E62410